MKHLRKIVLFFILIFAVGIFVTVKTVKCSLQNTSIPEQTLENQKEITFLLQGEKKNTFV